ncbi:MAG: SusD/RagB family nutrient-binding outer membrane lipoprotein [Candidatus Symbiothrix sp.]|nr:SusD/RagB family nutrient-binding outer membrane lipoprotein [Candidatus Symbiothrix sp.]
MKKNIYLPAILIAFVFAACSETLDDINSNPNATANPNPAYLLTGVEKQGADLYWGSSADYGGALLFVQHWAAIQYGDVDRYNFTNTTGIVTTPWNTGYTTLITDLNTILEHADASVNTKGAALTLRAWVFELLTELYGEIPYTDVGKSIVPVYNTQQEVYAALQTDLSQALTSLNTTNGAIDGDLVYGGDVDKWRKFAASLKLRLALRTADRDDAGAKQIIAALNVSELISNNSEIFQFVYTARPQNNPQEEHFLTRNDYRLSKTIVDKLKALADPRLPVYAALPEDPTVTTYEGGANGLSNSDASSQGFDKLSRPGAYFLNATAPAVIYTYAEVLFNLAEAAQRGYISGSAETYYRQAITASLNQFGITNTTDIADYLAQSSVTYDAANWKQSIGEQKWIAFFGQGLDAFAEWRRLDYPVLTAGNASLLNGKIPLRVFYPGTEQSLNGTNRAAAVARQGEDLLTTKLWFDVH